MPAYCLGPPSYLVSCVFSCTLDSWRSCHISVYICMHLRLSLPLYLSSLVSSSIHPVFHTPYSPTVDPFIFLFINNRSDQFATSKSDGMIYFEDCEWKVWLWKKVLTTKPPTETEILPCSVREIWRVVGEVRFRGNRTLTLDTVIFATRIPLNGRGPGGRGLISIQEYASTTLTYSYFPHMVDFRSMHRSMHRSSLCQVGLVISAWITKQRMAHQAFCLLYEGQDCEAEDWRSISGCSFYLARSLHLIRASLLAKIWIIVADL